MSAIYSTVSWRWQTLPLAVRIGTGVYLASRFAYSLVAILAVNLFSLPPGSIQLQSHFPRPLARNWLEIWLLEPWYRWDAEWFLAIVQQGYKVADGRSVYYPLYPALVRLTGDLLGHDYLLSGLLVSNIAVWLSLILLFKLVQLRYGERIASGTIVALALYPFFFFTFGYYPESLLLLFTVATFYAIDTGRWGWTAVFASLAVLGKVTAVILLAPVAWEFWQQRRRLFSGASLALLAIPLTLLGWNICLRLIGVEIPIADFSSPMGLLTPIFTPAYQTTFQSVVVWPWEAVRLGLQETWRLWGHSKSLTALLDIMIWLFFTVTIPFTVRLRHSTYVIYVVGLYIMNLTVVISAYHLVNFPRRMVMAFPVFVVLAMYSEYRWVRLPLVVVGSILSLVLSALFVWRVWIG